MRRALVLMMATLVGCPAPPRVAKTPSAPASITVVAPGVGRVAIVRRHTIQKLAVPALPGQDAGGQNLETRSETEETVQAVDGLAITKLLIHITRDDRTARVPKGAFPLPGMAGRRVEISISPSDKKLSMTPALSPLSAEEDDDLRDRYRLLGQPDPFLAHAPAGALALNARVPEYEEAFRLHFARNSADAKAVVSSAEVTYLDAATFGVHLTIDGLQHRFHVHGNFDGTLTVDPATGWVRTFTMFGRFRGTAPEAAGELIGEHLNEVVYGYR